jgi:hypothetical protein
MLLAHCSEDMHMQKGIWTILLIHSSMLRTSFTAIIISVGLYYNWQLFTSCWNLCRLDTHTHTSIRVLTHNLSTCKHACKPTNTYNTSSFSSFVPTQCCMQVHRWMVWLIVIEMHNEREHATDCFHWNKEHDINRPFVRCFAHFALLSPQSMEANRLLADQSKTEHLKLHGISLEGHHPMHILRLLEIKC